MGVREKLVELLDNFHRDLSPFAGNEKLFVVDDNVEQAEYLIEHGVTVQEWIPADKRMPTQEDAPTEYVFTAYKNQNCYDAGIALWDTVVAYPDLYDYWMALPLPQPPKEVEQC